MCASSRSLTTRTSSLSFPTSWRAIVSEHRGSGRPLTRVLGHLVLKHFAQHPKPRLTSSPGSNFLPPRERVGWTYSWTHKPVHPAEVLSPLLLQTKTTLLVLPCLGKGATELLPLDPPSEIYSGDAVPSQPPLPKQAGELPTLPSCRVELWEGLAAFLSTTSPASPWSGLGPLDGFLNITCPCASVRECAPF